MVSSSPKSSERSISASSSNSILLRWAALRLRARATTSEGLWRRAGEPRLANSRRLSLGNRRVKSFIVSSLESCMSFRSNRMSASKTQELSNWKDREHQRRQSASPAPLRLRTAVSSLRQRCYDLGVEAHDLGLASDDLVSSNWST